MEGAATFDVHGGLGFGDADADTAALEEGVSARMETDFFLQLTVHDVEDGVGFGPERALADAVVAVEEEFPVGAVEHEAAGGLPDEGEVIHGAALDLEGAGSAFQLTT